MKKALPIILCVVILCTLTACKDTGPSPSAQADALYPMPDSKTGLWGMVDAQGNFVVEPKYSLIGEFDANGYAYVILPDSPQIGYLDKKGNFYSSDQYSPEQVLFYADNGLAPKQNTDGLYGFVNKSGEWVIEPKYENAFGFSNGLACVEITLPGDLVPSRAFIDEKGTEVIPPIKWSNYPSFSDNGLADVERGIDSDAGADLRYRIYAYYYGLKTVDEATYKKIAANPDAYRPKNKGKNFLVDNYFKRLSGDDSETADGSEYPTYLEAVYYPMDFACGYMDKTGKITIPLQFYCVKPFSKNGFALAGDVWSNGLFGIIDEKGAFVVKPKFRDVTGFDKDGLSLAQENSAEGLWGVINEKGEWVVQPTFTNDPTTTPFGRMEGADHWYEAFKSLPNEDGLYGYIDENYNYYIEPQFKMATVFSQDGYAVVQNKDALWGVIDKTGAYVVQPTYKDYKGTYNGSYLVQDAKGLWGYIDDKGTYVISPR